MAYDDVPPDDMHLFGRTRDPLDAALRGEADDPAVAALVDDLRSAYLPDGTPARSRALAAFAGTGDEPIVAVRPSPSRPLAPVVEPVASPGRRIAVGVAAFVATLSGKLVLGGAVAAATLGGLHAADVVDVPLLPRVPHAQTVPSTVPELPDAVPPAAGATEGRSTGDIGRSRHADRVGPAPTPAPGPTSDAVDGHDPTVPAAERPGPDAPGPAPTPAPVPTSAPAAPPATAAPGPAAPPAPTGDAGAPSGRDTDGSAADGSGQADAPDAVPAPAGDEQRTRPRP